MESALSVYVGSGTLRTTFTLFDVDEVGMKPNLHDMRTRSSEHWSRQTDKDISIVHDFDRDSFLIFQLVSALHSLAFDVVDADDMRLCCGKQL